MLYVRGGFGDEKSQLNELNRRLDQYLSRVRQLETENQQLVEEVLSLRSERGAEWAQVYHSEMCELRRRVEDLTVQKCEAELQRDNLFQELQELQELWEQVKKMRLKIDQQLAQHKQDLHQAQKSQAALEQLYVQLQQEYQMLQGSHEEEMTTLRNQTFQMPLQITMQEVLRPKLSLTEVQSFSLELSDSWKDAFVFYQKKIEELESILRLSEENWHGAEDEVTIHRLEFEKVRKEYEELLALKTRLEDELLRMKAKYRLEVEEYQFIIEELETERKIITVNITERLKDYHDLMQVKTGLSLEVAAYRALLEAESKKGSVIITEHNTRDSRPAGYVTSTLEETTRFSNRGREKFQYPITKSQGETQWKVQTADSGRFQTRTVPQTQISPRYTTLANMSSSFGPRIYETTSQQRYGRWDTSLSPRYDFSLKSEATPTVLYQTVHPKTVAPYSSTQSTIISRTSQHEQITDEKPVARPRSRSKEARRVPVDIKVENKRQESDSQKVFATEIVKDRKLELQSVKETKQVVEGNEKMGANENRKKYDETVSVTETVQRETIEEPKTQELPVKKERKKREQAKKRKEEQENVAFGDMNVEGGSTVAVNETTQVKNTTVLGDQPIFYEIPIKFEKRKQEDVEEHKARNVSQTYVNQETTSQRKSGQYGETNLENREQKILVDDYLKDLGQSSVFEKNKTLLEENNQGSRFMKTFVTGEKPKDKQVVMEIPIQLEGNRKETSSCKENVENSVQSRISENVNRIIIGEKERVGVDENNFHKGFENIEFIRAEEPSSISSETIENKVLVTDILKQLGHPSDLDDTNVTYLERKQKCSDGSMKTEILVESKVEEDLDLFDEPDLTDLWNTASVSPSQKSEAANVPVEEIQSRKIKKTILEDITGAEAEEWIGNVVHTGLKGSPGKSVNVEIVQESIGTFAYEKGECSPPFHVEETWDNYNKEESENTEEIPASIRTDQTQEDITGAEAEEWIGNVIHTGLKGSPGKSVNVEIVEESIGTFAFEKREYSIPFHVEEAEDNYYKEESVDTEERPASVRSDKTQDNIQPSESPARVEEIIEGEHVDEEIDYFVSIPDDNPYVQEEEEETIRGQIYTEEESHGSYSWQDEFLQGSQGRKSLSEMLKQATTTEQSSTNYRTTADYSDTLDKEEQKETSHVKTLVIEKANTYESSVDKDNELQWQQQNEDAPVEAIWIAKAATYGSSVDSGDSSDMTKQDRQIHVKTIGIEKADSYGSSMYSSKGFDAEEHGGEFPVETVVIEKTIKASPEVQLSLIDFLSKDLKDSHEKLKGTLECLQGSLHKELAEELSILAGEEQTQTSSLAVDIKKLGQADKSGLVTIVAEISVSKTLDADDVNDLDLSRITESEERSIRKSQTASSEDLLQKEESTAENKFNRSQEDSYSSFTLAMNNREQRYTPEENVAKSPTAASVHFSPTQEVSFGQSSTDASRFIKRIELDNLDQIFQLEPVSSQSSAASISPTETNRSEHHIKLTSKEPLYNKQIVFEGPISETLKLDIVKNTEETSEQNRSIRHIKISPTENAPTEQIIFQGPLFKTLGMGAAGELAAQERYVEHVSRATRSSFFESFQVGSQETTSQSTEFTAGSSKTASHFKVSPSESISTQVMFEGSIPTTHDFSRPSRLETDNSEDDIRPIEHSSAAQKIHASKQVKYQGYVSEKHTSEDHGNIAERSEQTNVNTSTHHIKLSPSKEHIVFGGPISANFHISGEDKTYVEDTNRPIRHIRLGSPEAHMPEFVTFEGPTTESYESSDFFVSSPSGDSTESERSIKHIKLGPKEKTFTFQMDVTKFATKHSEGKGVEDSGMVITSSKSEGQPGFSQSSTELMDDPEVAESGYGEEEIAGVSQFAYEILPQSQDITETSELEKAVQMQRMIHQSHMVSGEKRVAIVYLDEEEVEEEEEEEADQDYLRRSF